MGRAVAELRAHPWFTRTGVMSSLSALKHAGARPLWLSLLFIVVLRVAVGDNREPSVSCYKWSGRPTNLRLLLASANGNTLLISALAAKSATFAGNAACLQRRQRETCTVCGARSYGEDDDGSVQTLFCQSVFNFLSFLTCRRLSWQRLSPHRETICDTNATQALTRRATICHGPRQNHNAAPHRGLLIVSILCSSTSLVCCR